MFSDDIFLLISTIPDGCFICGCSFDPKVQIFHSLEGLVNHFHDMMEDKVEHTYPVELLLLDFDGTVEGNLNLGFDSGCFSNGLKGVNFKYNDLIYKLKRGGRSG